MPYPQDWDACEDKLKELYPDDRERGRVRKKLLDLDEALAVQYFYDSDVAVKVTLDGFLKEGELKTPCHRHMMPQLLPPYVCLP